MTDGRMIYFGKKASDLSKKICLDPKMANRHGFICGATGTGKTVTLKVLAESFSKIGVPVFLADVKGDLAGMVKPGEQSESMNKRIEKFGLSADGFSFRAFPTCFYDVYGKEGIPLRTTISEMGPLLLSEILGLNDTQSDLLSVVFKIADDHGLLLYDTKDLKAALSFCSETAADLEMEYGHIAKASRNTIIRAIVSLETEGGDKFFGEPAIDINDFFATDSSGMGMINILASGTLINKPRLYSAFMLYLLSELFEILPEAGDLDKPKMVFFFDEAHLLFENCEKVLMEKINQVIKLIRSKGVGIFFVTQSPSDIPEAVMGQLSNKIEHALRAYTPAEIKALKCAAEAFRVNPEFDTADMLSRLATGEALVSLLDDSGIPTITEHVCILPPESSMGTISDTERRAFVITSANAGKYSEMIDSDSAYEFLMRRKKQSEDDEKQASEEKARVKEEAKLQKEKEKQEAADIKAREKEEAKALKEAEKQAEKERKEAEKSAKKLKTGAKSVLSTTAGTIGRELGKSVGGSMFGSFGKTLGGNVGASLGRNILGTLFKL